MIGRRPIAGGLIVALGLVALSMQVAPVRGQRATFAAKVEGVRVDVLVTEKGRPVAGLRATDFEVRDNGVLQDATLVGAEQLPLNVTLALDTSASLAGERLTHLKTAARTLVASLNGNDRAALVTFNQRLRVASPLTGDFALLRQAVDRLEPSGNTALYDAVYAGLTLAESEVGRNLLIIFTDGADTISYLPRQSVIDAAKETEVVAYGAAVARPGHAAFLTEFVDETGGNVLRVESIRDLPNAFVRILDEFRHRYVLAYSPRSVEKSGWHRIDVQVKGRRVTVKARAGYQAGS